MGLGEAPVSEYDELTHTLDGIYDAAVDPTHWQSAMQRIAEFLQSRACYVFVIDKIDKTVPLSIEHGMDPACIQAYEEYYATICPRLEYTVANPDATVFADFAHIDDSGIDKHEFYADYLAGYDLRYYLAAKVIDDDRLSSFVTVQRTARQGHVQDIEIDRAKLLLPHLRRVVELNQKLGTVDMRLAATEGIVEGLATATLLVDANSTIVFMNQAARELVGRRDGLSVRNGQLVAEQASDHAALQRMIGGAASRERADVRSAGGNMVIRKPSGGRAYGVQISPLSKRVPIFARHAVAGAIIFITDPDRSAPVSSDHLAALFSLTPSEADLAVALANGETLGAYAVRRAISVETVRFHLKGVFQKTDTHRQSDLIKLLMSTVTRHLRGDGG